MLSHSYVVVDQDEFIKAFELLYADDDYKKKDREKCLSELFGNICELSEKVVGTLKAEIKQNEI